jgi:hypothetical protein
MHALVMKRKMEINKYLKIVKLIESEEHKANMAIERTKITFLQAKQKKRKEWWRMDNHFRESIRKDLEAASIKIKNPPSRNGNDTSISSNSVASNKYSEFSLPLIVTSETDVLKSKRSSFFSDTENDDLLPKTNLSANNAVNEKTQLKKAPITPHNTPSINLMFKPSTKSLLVQPTTQVSQIPLSQIQNKPNEPNSPNKNEISNDENKGNNSIIKLVDERENTRRPLSVNLVKIISKRKGITINEILPSLKIADEDANNIQEIADKNIFSSVDVFSDIKETNAISAQKTVTEKSSSKLSDLKRNNVKNIMKTTILNNNKKPKEKSDDSDDYQTTVSRFLWKTPFHVETSNNLQKLEAETDSIKRQISKQKSLSLSRDNRYNNLLKSLNEKID